MQKVKNLFELNGPLLVFGGVYSNLQALEKMEAIALGLQIPETQVICTGDIVGFCAQPEECVQAIIDWGIHAIAGNVEIQLREGADDCGCNFETNSRSDIFSKRWYPYAQKNLSPTALAWMQHLPNQLSFEFGGKQVRVLHGAHHQVASYIFRSTPWPEKARNFADTGADIILAGHSGLPFSSREEGKLWLNAGAIGMPANDGTARVWYLILEEGPKGVNFAHQSFVYDHHSTYRQMIQHQLPIEHAETLRTGLWDNCETLPEVETREQGMRLVLGEKN